MFTESTLPESTAEGSSLFSFSRAAIELTKRAVCATTVESSFSFGPFVEKKKGSTRLFRVGKIQLTGLN